MFNKSIIAISVALSVSACGGGGGSSDGDTATGQFKDSNTAGISYVSGSQSGITGQDGSFTYEVGETVTFSIGGVTLGTAEGKSIVTPVDLVSGGSSTSTEVLNIVRFLIMLDEDGDLSNGISVSTSVQSAAEAWSQVDFSATNLSAELTPIMSDAVSADGGTHILLSANTAQAHLESTLLCSYAGAYKGTYSGDDHGNFGVLIDATTGYVEGIAYSTAEFEYIGLTGSTPISYDQNVRFVSGNATDGATFSGQFSSVNRVEGTWQNTYYSTNGSFTGSRIGGVMNARYRFTGNYIGGDYGSFSFDIDDSNNITGIAYSVADDESLTISGTLSGTTLAATTSDGATIAGSLNTATGTLSGTWSDSSEGTSGTFSGSGCKLN